MTLLLAILWLPVTSHCQLLELTSGLEALACCNHPGPDDCSESHEAECATDACAVIEGANYKSPQQRVTVPPFVAQGLFAIAPISETLPSSVIAGLHQGDEALARLPVTWQFSLRTALLPRSPSLAS